MGIRKEYLNFLNENCTLFKVKILELGNQIIKDDCAGHIKTGKELFSSMGCYHISMDTNGLDGAVNEDLGKKITGYDNEFDIICDFGTSICVDNYKMCYQNMVKMCKPGGTMVFILPEVGSDWKANHYVDKKFFVDFAKKNNCKAKKIKVIDGLHGNLVCAALVKNESIE